MFYNSEKVGYDLRVGLQNSRFDPNSSLYHFYTSHLILVYGGTMPSGADFTTNWGTDYEPVSGSEILVKYTATFSGSDNLIYVPTVPTSGTYVADGTATWAALLPSYNVSNTQIWGTSVNPPAWIVDVSEPSGTGVVQLNSTTVSGSAPSFNSCSFTLTGE